MHRAVRAFQDPHTRRALLLGVPTLALAFTVAGLVGSREWFLLRATVLWLIGIATLIQWRLAPLVRDVPPRHVGRPLERFGRHPLGALVLGMLGTAPLAALGPLLDSRVVSLANRVQAWQIAAFVTAFIGGLAGVAVWNSSVGQAARRRDESLRARKGASAHSAP